MSTDVFPSLPIGWPVIRTDSWATRDPRSISGKRTLISDRSQPIYSYDLTFEDLRYYGAFVEYSTMVGFFNKRKGKGDSFLYSDRYDNTATNQGFGTGDGVTALFQLQSSFGGAGPFPVLAPNTVTDVKVATVPQTLGTGAAQYNVTLWGGTYLSGGGPSTDPPGSVRFGASIIPAAATALTWDGTYYFPVSFMDDKCEFEQFMDGRFMLKKLSWEQLI